MILKDAERFGKDVFEVCTRPGVIKASNVSFYTSTFAQKFPRGDYKLVNRFYDDVDENILNVTLFAYFG
jgi:hypothetical protein